MNEKQTTFLTILENMSGRATNKVMRQELGWDNADYQQVRSQLLKAKAIKLGRGRGGVVMLKDFKVQEVITLAEAAVVVDPFPSAWRKL